MGKVYFGKLQLPILFYISLFTVISHAGCWNWQEVQYGGAPKVEICLYGECIKIISSLACEHNASIIYLG